MKEEFFEYYHPTKEGYDALWSEALIVLDTNALLDLYRFPGNARADFISILEKLRDRLWMAHQVGLEFHRNRPTVMSTKGKSIDTALSKTENLYNEVEKNVLSLEIDKNNLGIETQPLLDKLKLVSDELSSAIKKVHEAQKAVVASDTIRESVAELYKNKVGPGPETDADLLVLISDAERRYNEKIPPGYMDLEKGNAKEPTFYHNNLKYEKKHGDLIFWRQLMIHVKEKGIKSVILVTGEKKEDWWQEKEGKTVGPQPELIREIHRETNIESFWMYSPDQFMKFAGEFLNATVTQKSIEEVREVGRQIDSIIEAEGKLASEMNNDPKIFGSSSNAQNRRSLQRKIISDMSNWLEGYADELTQSIFPDYLGQIQGSEYGFELIYTNGILGPAYQKTLMEKIDMVRLNADVEVKNLYIVIGMSAAAYRREFGVYQKRGRQVLIAAHLRALDPSRSLAGTYFGYSDGSAFRAVHYRAGAGPDFVADEELDIFRSGTKEE